MWCSLPRFIRPITAVSSLPNSSLTILCHHGVSAAAIYSPEKLEYSTQLVTREYADLNLSNNDCQEVGHVRVRKHVNPLSFFKMVPVEFPDWNAVYKDAKLPLMVDIGSGSGRFLLWLAKRNCGLKNYLGLEIRPKLAKRAEHWVHELGLNNIHFMHANATVSFKQFISTYPGPLVLVSILCPDPHFKKKHHKRRVVQNPLVDSIVKGLVPGGQVFFNICHTRHHFLFLFFLSTTPIIFIQSEVQEVAVDMRKYFDAEFDKLVHINHVDPNILCDNDGWLLSNPMGIRTEREIHAELEGASIYRRMYQKQW
ncbi:tRNA (guanine-N(7)-)-methyltransferase-like isoform X1 [Salvia splendens]|uniref:tRNA (guanine-N(7)-)-methyltransferase-like isoform X1 n=1 Tax=Salvia splendens TaxID=180675 RepID=UPI001C278B1C|nr:tRNA (guanine-N(7)-)-methyltransferase-like isoform X1 [Salvia splendens]